jgi:hypothetical protein
MVLKGIVEGTGEWFEKLEKGKKELLGRVEKERNDMIDALDLDSSNELSGEGAGVYESLNDDYDKSVKKIRDWYDDTKLKLIDLARGAAFRNLGELLKLDHDEMNGRNYCSTPEMTQETISSYLETDSINGRICILSPIKKSNFGLARNLEIKLGDIFTKYRNSSIQFELGIEPFRNYSKFVLRTDTEPNKLAEVVREKIMEMQPEGFEDAKLSHGLEDITFEKWKGVYPLL